MTDNEIIKALGTVSFGGHSCMNCKRKVDKGEERCGLKGCIITRNALDLINRQKAELKEKDEMLSAQADVIKTLERALDEKAAEVVRYEKTVGKLVVDDNVIAYALLNGKETEYISKKAAEVFKNIAVNNAIKEFAERLKNKMFSEDYLLCEPCYMADIIDNLVKEMTESQ